MRIKILFLFVFVLCCFAQYDLENIEVLCEYPIGALNTVHAEGNLCFAAYGGRLNIIDTTDKLNLQIVSDLYIAEEIEDFFVDGDYLYVSALNDGLFIIDISRPDIPRIVSTFDNAGSILLQETIVSDNIAYLACFYRGGLIILDVTDPTSPEEISIISTFSASPQRISLRDSILFLADESNLHIYNVSDPSTPVEISSLSGYYEYLKHLEVEGNICYVGREIIDITDLSTPTSLIFSDWDYADINGVYGFSHNISEQISIVNLDDAASPYLYSEIETSPEVADLCYEDDYLYIADIRNGIMVNDVSDPSEPVLQSIYGASIITTPGINIKDDYVYVSRNGVKILDISDPTMPFETASINGNNSPKTVLYENYLYVFSTEIIRNHKLTCYDISDPLSPAFVEEIVFDDSFSFRNMQIKDNKLIVSLIDDIQKVYNITDSGELEFIGEFVFAHGHEVTFCGDVGIFKSDDDIVEFYDFSDILTPVSQGSFDFDLGWYDDFEFHHEILAYACHHSLIYCSCSDTMLRILDFTDPTSPCCIDSGYLIPCYEMNIFQNHVYTYQRDNGFVVYNLDSILTSTEAGHFNAPEDSPRYIYVDDKVAVVTSNTDGPIFFIDISHFNESITTHPLNTPESITLAAYPNPFNSILNITLPPNTSSIEIADINGKTVHSSSITNQSCYSWSPSDGIASGVYKVKVQTNDKEITSKVVYIK